jgi:type IV pilus assembly protein PilY1
MVLGLSMVLPSHLTVAATTDLANIPLVNATAAVVLPNVYFILDDSGSMARDYLPDDAGTTNFWKSPHCNGLAYNPATTYSPAVNFDGTYKANSTFTLAWDDGYSTGSGSTNLTGAIYYTYTGTELDMDFKYLAGIPGVFDPTTVFYRECNSVPGPPWSAVIKLAGNTSGSGTVVNSITVGGGPNIMSGPSASSTARDTVGASVRDKINAGTAGYTATYVNGTDELTITTNSSSVGDLVPVVTKASASTNITFAPTAFPSTIGIPKFTQGAPTTAIQKTNYANWYSYYRTRNLMAKTSIGLAFKDIRGWPLDISMVPTDANYFHGRVGYSSISDSSTTTSSTFLPIAEFNTAINTAGASPSHPDNQQKKKFYDNLYAAGGSSTTPLRGALSKAGRYFAGKYNSASSPDPIQYSCQKNFTILITDGYWNTGSDTATYKQNAVDNSLIGNVDGAADVTFPSKDTLGSSGSLADVAYYYYHNDLRPCVGDVLVPTITTTWPSSKCKNNVLPAVSDKDSPTEDVADWQHMVTYTVGLGLNGRLRYDPNYKSETATSLITDYYQITKGTKSWPNPSTADTSTSVIERVDDLWHAAVNGRGQYFSAKNPTALQASLESALSSMAQKVGAGAAAGTSSLNPTAGNNTTFVATYTTVAWSGDVNAYSVDLNTGIPDLNNTKWSASALLAARIQAGGGGESPERKIYTGANPTTGLKDFKWGNLTATEQGFLDNTKLSQYAGWTATQKTAGTGQNMLNYLRGWYQYEEETDAVQLLYRNRKNGPRYNLGDIAHAQPIYVQVPPYSFADDGYMAFKTAKADRPGALYVSSNDGMVHAFRALNPGGSVAGLGEETWAYIPPMVMPNLWRLADTQYPDNHIYFVDGPVAAVDVDFGASGSPDWRTVLLASMGKGGRGYFALDITNPDTPKVLWSFTADPAFSSKPSDGNYSDQNIGYTYGTPLAAKLTDGTWVAVMTSGYNNVPETVPLYTGAPLFGGADGIGRVFVIDMKTGKKIRTISTGVGSVATPSGLGKINTITDNFGGDNTSALAYGGDLYGNMYRFNLNTGTATKLFVGSAAQPITVAPEIGVANNGTTTGGGMVATGQKMIYFGTGRYLGQSDLSDHTVQSVYAIKDNDSGNTITGTSTLIQQTQASAGAAITGGGVDLIAKNGWFFNLKGVGERVALDPQLHLGVLVVLTTIPVDTSDPNTSACSPGGSGMVYQLDYGRGTSFSVTSLSEPPVGVSPQQIQANAATGQAELKKLSILGGGGTLVTTTLMDNPTLGGSSGAARVLWRELTN